MADELEIRRKRLLYQASHRGTQESDLVVGGFAKLHLNRFGPEELDRFEALINVTDADLMDWLAGRVEPPKALKGDILNLMINFKNELLNN
jgi:antitoxin CptB